MSMLWRWIRQAVLTRQSFNVAAIALVAVTLRFAHISRESLGYDETASWAYSTTLPSALHSEANKPPLFYVLLYFWTVVWGSSEFAMRSLSAIASTGVVLCVYIFSLELFGRKHATWTAIYCAVATFQIYYAQEARVYSLLMAFTVLQALFLWRALSSERESSQWTYYGLFSVFAALSLYSHYVSVFFLLGFSGFVVMRHPKQLWRFVAAVTIAMIVFAPWLLIAVKWTYSATTAAHPNFLPKPHIPLRFPQAYFSFLFGETLIPIDSESVSNIKQTLLGRWWVIALAVFSVGTLTSGIHRAARRYGDSFRYVLALATIPSLSALALSIAIPFFDRRYLSPASPFLYAVLVALGAALWKNKSGNVARRTMEIGALATFAVLVGLSLTMYYFDARLGKDQWREVAEFLETAPKVDSTIVVFDPDTFEKCYRYYGRRNLQTVGVPDDFSPSDATAGGALASMTRNMHSVFLVRSVNSHAAVLTALRRQYKQVERRFFPKANTIEVIRFIPNAAE